MRAGRPSDADGAQGAAPPRTDPHGSRGRDPPPDVARRVALTVFAFAAAAAAYLALEPLLGMGVAAILLAPAAVGAWLFGARGGVVAAAAVVPALAALVSLSGGDAVAAVTRDGLPGLAVIFGVALAVGRVRDLRAGVRAAAREQAAAESELRESEERFRSLVELSFDGVAIHESGVVRDVNHAFAALFGFDSPEEVVGRPVLDLIDTESRAVVADHLDSPRDDTYGVVGRRRDGSRVELEVSARDCRHLGRPARVVAVRDVTRRNADEREKRFQARLLDAVGEAVIATDVDGRIVYWNRAAERLYGWRADEVMGRSVTEVTPAAMSRDEAERLMAALAQGASWSGEFMVRRRDGTEFPASVTDSPVLDERGRVVAVIGVSEDVSASKRAERALRESEERFRSLYENSTMGIYRSTPDGRVLLANPAILRMLGYASFEEVAARDLERDGPDAAYSRREFRERIERDGEIRGLEVPWRRRDGAVIHVRESARAVRSPEGDVLYYEGVVEDVTQRRAAEDALREEEARMRAILASSLDAIVTLDADGRVVEFNAAATRIFGRAREDALGRDGAEILLAERDRCLIRDAVRDLRDGGDGPVLGRRFDAAAVRAGGAEFPAEVALTVVSLPGARGCTLFLRDISERVRLEAEAHRQREILSRNERLSALGTLVAGVAHEINNPLMYITGNIELAIDDIADADRELAEAGVPAPAGLSESRRGLESARAGAERIARITKALKSVARQPDSPREVVDVREVVQSVAELVTVGIPPNVSPSFEHDASPLPVLGNASELHQVLLNLTKNAVESLGPGGGAVRVSCARRGDWADLEVADTGPGIPRDVRARLFDPFFTTKPHGTGLGLSIVHAIVKDHGGEILVDSEPGRGTRFRVRLPLASSPHAAPAPEPAPARGLTRP